MTHAEELLPFVSVIVPVYNDAAQIRSCLDALREQTYPAARYEIIVVDNGSTDHTPRVVAAYDVQLRSEPTVQSSYAARNVGIAAARGTVLAFTDSDCRPVADWIRRGVQALTAQGADLVGGVVRFVHTGSPTGAEVCDSITNMQIERGIRERGVAKTANLFVRAAVVEATGGFPPVRSGGDVRWTRQATDAGYTLAYGASAVVDHPARRLPELVRKQYRVGRGQPAIWGAAGWSTAGAARAMARCLLPDATPTGLRDEVRRAGVHADAALLRRVWGARWACRVSMLLGNLRELPALWRHRSDPERACEPA